MGANPCNIPVHFEKASAYVAEKVMVDLQSSDVAGKITACEFHAITREATSKKHAGQSQTSQEKNTHESSWKNSMKPPRRFKKRSGCLKTVTYNDDSDFNNDAGSRWSF